MQKQVPGVFFTYSIHLRERENTKSFEVKADLKARTYVSSPFSPVVHQGKYM